MAVDLSPYFIPACPDCIYIELDILSIFYLAFLGFMLGIIVFLANDARSIQL